MDSYTKPKPRIDALNRPFWEHARAGQLALQTCDDCGDRHFPPSPICPACNSDRQSWQVASGRGTLQSWIAFHRAYWPGFAADVPYDVCLVKLEEGPLLVSNLVGGTTGAKLGAPVTVVFDRVSDELSLPKWTIAAA